MGFKSIEMETKKWRLCFLSLLLFWWVLSASGICSASGMPEPMYQITESELRTLETNLAQLRSVNERLQVDLRAQSSEATQLKKELAELKKELAELKKELSDLKALSVTQESSLTNANKLLDEYAIVAKKERLRIKAQRNTWVAATVIACLACAMK